MPRLREVGLLVASHAVEGPFDGYKFNAHMKYDGCSLNRYLAVVKVITNPSDGIGIVIGGKTYIFRTAPTLATEVAIGLTKPATIKNLLAKVNLEQAVTLCTGYTGENSIGNEDSFVLVGNKVEVEPTLTVDGTQIVKTIAFTLSLTQNQINDATLFSF